MDEFGTDAVRYFLLRHIHPFEDSDFTRDRFIEDYNANLANGLGNLVSRVMKLAETHLDAPADISEHEAFDDYLGLLSAYQFNESCDLIWKEIAACDVRIQEEKPFSVIKTDPEKGKAQIADLVRTVYRIARMLHPIMPATSALIKQAVKENKKPENLFARRD